MYPVAMSVRGGMFANAPRSRTTAAIPSRGRPRTMRASFPRHDGEPRALSPDRTASSRPFVSSCRAILVVVVAAPPWPDRMSTRTFRQ
jgi:hypothetical protein